MIWESHLLQEKWSLSQENMTSMKWISQRLSLRVEIHKDFKLYQVLMCSSRMLKCNNIPNIKVCTPLPFCWVGGWNFYQIFRKEGGGGVLDKTSGFRGGLLGKKGVTFFRGACNLLIKHLKSEMFNDKKSLSRWILCSVNSNWESLTKNSDIFKYIFWDKCPKKSDNKKIWTMSKCLDIHKYFWTISSDKTFQYSKIVYIKSIPHQKLVALLFFSSSDMQRF